MGLSVERCSYFGGTNDGRTSGAERQTATYHPHRRLYRQRRSGKTANQAKGLVAVIGSEVDTKAGDTAGAVLQQVPDSRAQ